jgi:hypothetical protein
VEGSKSKRKEITKTTKAASTLSTFSTPSTLYTRRIIEIVMSKKIREIFDRVEAGMTAASAAVVPKDISLNGAS